MRTCLVYVPERARLYTLNVDAWLIFELAGTGSSGPELLDRYGAATGINDAAAGPRLAAGLARLVENGILETATPSTKME